MISESLSGVSLRIQLPLRLGALPGPMKGEFPLQPGPMKGEFPLQPGPMKGEFPLQPGPMKGHCIRRQLKKGLNVSRLKV